MDINGYEYLSDPQQNGYWLIPRYHLLNKTHFDSKLPSKTYIVYNVPVPSVNDDDLSAGAYIGSINNIDYPLEGTEEFLLVKDKLLLIPNEGLIFIAPSAVNKGPPHLEDTLLHEMTHQYLVLIKKIRDPDYHGKLFIEKANEISRKRKWPKIYTEYQARDWPIRS